LPELLFLWTNGQLMAGAEPAFLFLRALRPLRVVLLLENLRDFVGQIKGSAKPLLNTFLMVFFCFIVMGILGVTQLAGKMNFCTDSLIHSKSQCVGMTDAGEVREWKKPALNYDWIGQGTVTMFALVLTAGSHDEISKSSAEIKLVNNMFQILNGENNYALAA
jgi:hypothetical protein